MVMFKNSSLYLALCSIVLFASVVPAIAMNPATNTRSNSAKSAQNRPARPILKPQAKKDVDLNAPIKDESAYAKKRKLTWKQKLRKNLKAFASEVKEFVTENPAATLATVLGGALLTWILWNRDFVPWERRENVVGNSACQIIEGRIQPGFERNFLHQELVQERVWNPQSIQNPESGQWEGRWEIGEGIERINRAQVRLNDMVQIMQLRVARQGLDGSCGYHATKNCMLILNELAHPQGDLQVRLDERDLCQRFFGQNGLWSQRGIWRQRIMQNHLMRTGEECEDGGDWLDGQAVRNLVDHEYANHELLNPIYNQNIVQYPVPELDPQGAQLFDENGAFRMINREEDRSPITIIEDANRINHPNEILNATAVAHRSLMQAIQDNIEYRHGFIFNTARTINGRIPRRDGHWLAAVVHRDAQGQIRWYVADSSNRSIVEYGVLRDLIAAVQGEVVQNPPVQ